MLPSDEIGLELQAIRDQGLWRDCVEVQSPPGPHITIDGRKYLHLCSNNYLDLASHSAVIEGARQAAAEWGAGAGSARLITGTNRLTVEFEEDLAQFKQTEAALLFSSGYLANLGAVQSLAGRGDWLICDRLNHASLIDAARLSGAEIHVYPHNDVEAAERILKKAPANVRKAILSDGVFSMDGDLARLRELNELARDHRAWLVVDDAHGTGVVGPEGRGSCAAAGIAGEHLIQVVTLSKALGSQGGAVVAARSIIDLLVNRARSFIFETALAPACVGAARAALHIIQQDEVRRSQLKKNAHRVREGLNAICPGMAKDETPIIPLAIGDNELAMRLADRFRECGYWLTAIRPPSVEIGKARLRLTVMSTHTSDELDRFVGDAPQILSLE